MKKLLRAVFAMIVATPCFVTSGLFAQQLENNRYVTNTDAGEYSCVPGPHDRTWTDGNGHKIVEMATGMNYWDGQQWSPSIASFQISQDRKVASATNIQHKVWLSSNLNTNGAVSVLTPDGLTLNSTPVAIALYDAASGNFATIASITNCTGFLVSSNKIVYSNAFVGLCADVVYTLERGSFQQDVVIKGHLNPGDFGFPNNTTRIQILTEFYRSPQPDQVLRPIRIETNQPARSSMASPDFMDRTVGFGNLVLGPGRAFTAASTSSSDGAPVAKQFIAITNQTSVRTFLIESVEYPSIQAELDLLPDCDGQLAWGGGRPEIRKTKMQYAQVPSPHPEIMAAAAFMQSDAKLAKNTIEEPQGVVIDYTATISGTGPSIFQADTTYFVSGNVTYTGSLTIEGGAVIKYPTNSVSIQLNSSLTINTLSYRPAIFTAADDDSVGDKLTTNIWAGYTGTIQTNGYGNPDLLFTFVFPGPMNYLRFSYAKQAVRFHSVLHGAGATIVHSQFVNCVQGINVPDGLGAQTAFLFNNCLMANVQSLLLTSNFNIYAFSSCTMDNSPFLAAGTNATLNATNCIFANSSTSSNVFGTSANNGFYNFTAFGSSQHSAGGAPFQTVGSGNYYLTDISGFRGVGVTNVDATLLSQLQQKTTYPPALVFANVTYTNDSTLYPYAQRDTNSSLDLGYHYDPIDVALGSVLLTNATLTVMPGTVIAGFDTNSTGYGLKIGPNGVLSCVGNPTSLARIINYNTVQEQSTNWSKPTNGVILANSITNGSASVINCRFTDFSVMADDTAHIYASSNGVTAPINLQDCQLHGGSLTSFGPTINLTNNLLERVTSQLWSYDANAPFIGNNLFWAGTNNLQLSVTNAVVQNNMFDQTGINDHGNTNYLGGYNGYVTNFNRLTLQPHDVVLTNSSYLAGALGNYYLPTNSLLINFGSTNANLLALYHYTMTTNQVKETNSIVDIGFHYVAVTSGLPFDSDGDGFPDYIEDSNGNGSVDSGETNWLDKRDFGLKVLITRPRSNTIIP